MVLSKLKHSKHRVLNNWNIKERIRDSSDHTW